MGCESGRQMKLTQNCVSWQGLILAVMNLQVLFSESQLNNLSDSDEMW
jgi:hypothetical protein